MIVSDIWNVLQSIKCISSNHLVYSKHTFSDFSCLLASHFLIQHCTLIIFFFLHNALTRLILPLHSDCSLIAALFLRRPLATCIANCALVTSTKLNYVTFLFPVGRLQEQGGMFKFIKPLSLLIHFVIRLYFNNSPCFPHVLSHSI